MISIEYLIAVRNTVDAIKELNKFVKSKDELVECVRILCLFSTVPTKEDKERWNHDLGD